MNCKIEMASAHARHEIHHLSLCEFAFCKNKENLHRHNFK